MFGVMTVNVLFVLLLFLVTHITRGDVLFSLCVSVL